MANIIEVHVLRAYSTNNVNRGENGEIKTVSVGGDVRTRQSSQSWKHMLRNALATYEQKTHHTRYVADILMNKLMEAKNISEEDAPVYRYIFDKVFNVKKKSKKNSERDHTEEINVYYDNELSAIVNAVYALYTDDNAFRDEIAKEYDKAAKKDAKENDDAKPKTSSNSSESGDTKAIKKVRDRVIEAVKSSTVGPEIALFGRMITTGIGGTVPSATHFNHAYSIDKYEGDFDYFTAVDTDLPKDTEGIGAAHLDSASIAANTMYGYFNIDPLQMYKNLCAELPYLDIDASDIPAKEREYKETVKKQIINLIKLYLLSHPEGKQNSTASYPTPSVVYITVVRDGFPCTLDSLFSLPIVRYENETSVPAIGAKKILGYIKEDAIQTYDRQYLLLDSVTRRCIERGTNKASADGTVEAYARALETDNVLMPINKLGDVLTDLSAVIEDMLN